MNPRLASPALGALLAIGLTSPLHAGDLLVSSRFANAVFRYDATTGASKGVFASGNGLANPNGIAFGPDGNLYVGLGDVGVVQRWSRDGAFLGTFVSGGAGGLAGCRAISFGPDGNLYVAAGSIDKVLRYDGKTGAFLGVAAEGHGLDGPVGLTFGPDGNLYVGGALSQAIYAFRPDGTYVRTFARCAGASNVTGVLFGPDGRLYGADSVRNQVYRYDPATGACLGVFASGGGLAIPIGLGRSANGDLLVGSFDTSSVLSYSFQDGRFLGTFIASGAGGLSGTHNFAFVPDPPSETTRLVPIVLDVASGSAHYTTELALTNRGAAATSVTLRYHPSLGASTGGSATLTLPAGGQLVLDDVIAFLRERGLPLPADEPQAGTLEVAFSGAASDDAVAATARTTTAVGSPEGRAGLSYAALRAGSTSRLTVYGLRESASDRSNLATLSTSAEPVTVKVTVHPGDGGTPTVLREAETLPPFGWTQIGRVLQGTGTSNAWVEVERVGGSGSFSAYGVVNDNVTNDGSFLPPVPDGRSGSRLTVPVVTETATLGSELVLANRSSSPVTLTLSYVRSVNAPDGGDGTTSLTLAPREQRIVPDALAFLRGAGVPVGPAGETHVGSLRITVSGAPLDQVFAAARTGFRSGGGSFGLFTPAVVPAEEAADEVALYGLRADETNRTNVAVVNSGADAAGPVTLELHTHDGDAGGVEKGTPIRQTLAPGQHAQVNLILGEAGIRNGWVRVRRVDGTAPWLAYGVVNDGGAPGQRTGDGAYVAMEITDPVARGAGDFLVKNGNVTLAGTLDLPSTPGPYPVMVFIAGSGTADRQSDRSASGILLPQGIALFTYDKRGVGQSTGTYQNVDVENSDRLIRERASDVAAIVNFLSRHRDIDPEKIFLWGTSQGGWVAPLVALRSENVAFLICVNGGGSPVGVEVYYETLTRNQSLSISQATAMLAGYTGNPGYDPDAALRALAVPALFVYGGMDRNNPTFADIPRIDKVKAELGKDFTTFLFPNTNHDLIDVTTGTFDPQLFPKIIEWSRARIGALP